MSVSLFLQNKATGEYRHVPVSPQQLFMGEWMQLTQQLGLRLVPLFPDGSLTPVPAELIPEIVRELRILLAEVETSDDSEWIAERVRNILAAFAATNPAEWEYSFG